ncbi:MAG: hypothetical protein NC102_05780 [Clostridium sp.]|nr:hypothetical protein [Clostridium sp.]
MKRNITLAMAAACAIWQVSAAEAEWLKFTSKSGDETFLKSSGLVITKANGMLLCSSPAEEISLPLDNLASMEFTSRNAGVADAILGQAEGTTEAYSANGVLVGVYPSLQQAREALSALHGVFLLKTKSQTIKITSK